jgi:hypothetical protein
MTSFRKPGEKLVTLSDYDQLPSRTKIEDLTGRIYTKLHNEMWQDDLDNNFLYTPEQMLRFAGGTDVVVELPYGISESG